MRAPRIVIAGLRGGSGKTVVSLGLVAALRGRGLSVVPFKKGPDYIDAGWLAAASGRPCYNLDPFLIGSERLLQSFIRHFNGDCAVIEGNRGLFDGMDSRGSMSTAVVSKTLKSPVILVVDCTKMTRTTAAILLGIAQFDRGLMLGGVILNHIAGERHESVIRDSIKKYTKIPIFGAIPRIRELQMSERHMGLTPFREHPEVEQTIEGIKAIINKYVDINRVLEAAKGAPPLRRRPVSRPISRIDGAAKIFKAGPRIGILRDSAFQFYYPENLEELEKRGARLIEVSALRDRKLPPVDALYIGGGFPETHAIRLAENLTFKKSLKDAVEKDLPVYAECGGLMYLGRALSLDGAKHRMADVFPLDFVLHKKPQAHGYTVVRVTGNNAFFKAGTVLKGHEFHYSAAAGEDKGRLNYCLRVERGRGISDAMDGLVYKNVLATYTHLHAIGSPEWADGVIKAARTFSRL